MSKTEKTKEQRIKSEISKLKKNYSNLDKERMTLAMKLIENAAFMTITLEDLQKEINEKGSIRTVTNGNGFETIQEAPELKAYNAVMQRYTPCIKQLTDMLPDGQTTATAKAGEALAAFVQKGKPQGRDFK